MTPTIFGTTREHYGLLMAMAGSFGLFCGFVGAWIGARLGGAAGAKKAVGYLAQNGLDVAHARDVQALNEGIDVMMVELERIAESQRFLAKVLSERAEQPAIAPPRREPGQITPH